MTDETIFATALEQTDPAARAAYLAEACAGDPDRRRRVEGLLWAHEKARDFLEKPPVSLPDPGLMATRNFKTGETDPGESDDPLTFLTPPRRPDSLGRLGAYEILQILGRGGSGIVFRAFDDALQRVVAVKVLAPRLAITSPARKRFLREARSSARVRHENVVQVYAIGEQPLPYLVMEFIPGETLQQRLDRTGPLDAVEVVRIGRQVAEGLAAAHAQGLIHRDVKPGNILIEGGPHERVKITDFGLARAADDASVSQSGVVAGTPLYMAPEQAQGEVLDHRADLFSLGSVLYTMCSGRPPFRANTTLAVLKRVAEDTPRPIRDLIPEVPQWLCDVISKLHAKNPDDRFATAREVADLLTRHLDRTRHPSNSRPPDDAPPRLVPSLPEQPPSAEPAKRPARRGVGRWAVAAGLLLVLAGGMGLTEATGVTDVRGSVIRLFSPDGTLVVEVDDPRVKVEIDGSDLVITGAGAREIRLRPGTYTVKASKDGKPVSRELVTVTQSGRKVVRVTQEATDEVKAPNPVEETSAWERTVAALPAAEQVKAVVARLKELNPGFDGNVVSDITDNVVTRLHVKGNDVVNLGPVRALRGLSHLACEYTNVSDLSPLKGLKLTSFGAWGIPASDLTPLQGMPLKSLDLFKARGVKDLKPLKGLPLEYLNLTQSTVTDLSPLAGMATLRSLVLENMPHLDLAPLAGLKLDHLKLKKTRVSNLDVIKSLPLKSLAIDSPDTDRRVFLRGLEGLEQINDKTAADFWKEVDGKLNDPDRRAAEYVLARGGGVFVNDVERAVLTEADLPRDPFRLTAVMWNTAKVSEAGWAHFKDCTNLTQLHCWGTAVSDTGLAQFKGCANLTAVHLIGCQVDDAGLAHLAGFKKLTALDLHNNPVTDTGLALFKDHKGLLTLRLGLTQVTDAGLAHFKGCKDLTNLSLNHCQQVGDDGLAHFKDCKDLTRLELAETRVSDAGLALFKGCKNLKVLMLITTGIGDEGFAHFKDCKELTVLQLWDTKVGDRSLALLKECKNLEKLRLNNTRVSDAGLTHLEGCKNLKVLEVRKTRVTAAGVGRLKKALPECKIEWDDGATAPK